MTSEDVEESTLWSVDHVITSDFSFYCCYYKPKHGMIFNYRGVKYQLDQCIAWRLSVCWCVCVLDYFPFCLPIFLNSILFIFYLLFWLLFSIPYYSAIYSAFLFIIPNSLNHIQTLVYDIMNHFTGCVHLLFRVHCQWTLSV